MFLTILHMIKLFVSGKPTKKNNGFSMFNLPSFSCSIIRLENHHKDLARNNQIAGSAAEANTSIDETCEE